MNWHMKVPFKHTNSGCYYAHWRIKTHSRSNQVTILSCLVVLSVAILYHTTYFCSEHFKGRSSQSIQLWGRKNTPKSTKIYQSLRIQLQINHWGSNTWSNFVIFKVDGIFPSFDLWKPLHLEFGIAPGAKASLKAGCLAQDSKADSCVATVWGMEGLRHSTSNIFTFQLSVDWNEGL